MQGSSNRILLIAYSKLPFGSIEVRDFSFSSYGFLPFGKRNKGELELSLEENLIERLEQRF